MSDDGGNKIQKAGGTEDSYGHHQADECGHDLNDGEKTAACSFDKIVVYVCFLQNAVGYDGKNQEGDDKIGYVQK